MTVPSLGWRPLPDCPGCGRPTRRATFDRLGACSRCHATRHPVTAREEGQLAEWQATVSRINQQRQAEAAARAARRAARRRT